jgi:hypothetical protein
MLMTQEGNCEQLAIWRLQLVGQPNERRGLRGTPPMMVSLSSASSSSSDDAPSNNDLSRGGIA